MTVETAAPLARTADAVEGLLPYLAPALGVPPDALTRRWGALVLPDLAARLASSLHRLAAPGGRSTWAGAEEGAAQFRAAFACRDPAIGFVAARTAVAWLSPFVEPGQSTPPAPAPELARQRYLASVRPFALRAGTRLLIAEAERRGIPWTRLGTRSRLLCLGQGAKQRRLRDMLLDASPALASELASDRFAAAEMLAAAGVPVPPQVRIAGVERVVAAANRLGYPVALRRTGAATAPPLNPEIGDEAILRRALVGMEQAEIVVEKRLPGLDHRFLVVAGRVAAAMPSMPGSAGRGLGQDADAIPHPDVRALAERAARLCGLGQAGVVIRSVDISRSHLETGAVVRAIEPAPDLRDYVSAEAGPGVAAVLVGSLFPEGSDGRIPIAAITGTNGKTTVSRMVAAILEQAGHRVGLATTDGVSIAGSEIVRGDMAGLQGAGFVLRDPLVSAAVLETARGGIIATGLGYDACDVAAVLNVTDDHLGMDGVRTREEMAAVKGTVLRAARRVSVLNADDPLCVGLAARSVAPELIWFAQDARNPVVRDHLAGGGRAVTLDEGHERILIRETGAAIELIAIADMPATFGGRAAFNVANALAAAAIALGLGLERAAIARGLAGFASDVRQSAGRCNFIDGFPFQLLVDYAHNPASVSALCRFLAQEPVAGRRLLVLTTAGNREDRHFADIAAAAAGHFDAYVCTTNLARRRSVAEVAELLGAGLIASGVPPTAVRQASSEREALGLALTDAAPGDLLVVLSSNAAAIRAQLAAAMAPAPGS